MLGNVELPASSVRKGATVQSVSRALQIIQYFEETPELGITEIADRINLSKSTVYGLVYTLTAYGYLEQTEKFKKYKLGLKFFEFGNLVQRRMDVRQEARPHCQFLADKYRTTTHLATHSEGNIIYIDKVDNSGSVVVYSQIGKRAPMYCTGVGKAILAFLPDEYLDKYLFNHALVQITKNTIVTKEALLEELEKVRQQGYAMDNEEIEAGLCCIASPVFNHKNEPQMAISISFPFGRFDDLNKKEVTEDIQFYAKVISKRLGYENKI